MSCETSKALSLNECPHISCQPSEPQPEELVAEATAAQPRRRLRPNACQSLLDQIHYTVSELEHQQLEDQQYDYKLQMALLKQRDKIAQLQSSLENEQQRNERLVQLIRGVDTASSADDDEAHMFSHSRLSAGEYMLGGQQKWHSRSSVDAFESISPLLMQQRYDELSISHKQSQKQLVKKERMLTRCRCEKEELQAKYDQLLDEYRGVQKRFEGLCCKYLRLQSKKNHDTQRLSDTLTFASDCVLSAQQIIDHCLMDSSPIVLQREREFRQNLQLFIKALHYGKCVQRVQRTSCTS